MSSTVSCVRIGRPQQWIEADAAVTVASVLDAGIVGITVEDKRHAGNAARLSGIEEQCSRRRRRHVRKMFQVRGIH